MEHLAASAEDLIRSVSMGKKRRRVSEIKSLGDAIKVHQHLACVSSIDNPFWSRTPGYETLDLTN